MLIFIKKKIQKNLALIEFYQRGKGQKIFRASRLNSQQLRSFQKGTTKFFARFDRKLPKH